ncbi:MAG: hypothetical protein A3F90_04005 [Deltaproteobacteria bacterium RIFCSPLOWO2_12_FULL_60_19]|nr:MAG: hypothetical protein A3F90_04005 [Deltaproteobacteria bacterium RIFCSPLOWO2_12_FULL_60_19]
MLRKKSRKKLNAVGPAKLQRDSRHPLQLRWPAKFLKLLGRMPDTALAKKMGVSLDAVRDERRRQKIEPSLPHRPPVQWTAGMIRLLGGNVDARVAEKLGLPEYLVMHKRQRLGIPSHGDVPERRQPRAFNWTKRKIALLGTDSDRKIAERLGTIGGVVVRRRTRLGIPSFYRYRRISWTKEMVSLLGKTTDWEIAKKYGMKRESVARERRKRGIPPCIDARPVISTPALRPILSLPMRVIARRFLISRFQWRAPPAHRECISIEALLPFYEPFYEPLVTDTSKRYATPPKDPSHSGDERHAYV